MGDEWEQEPKSESGQPNFDDLDKRIDEFKRTLIQGANEAQQRLKRVVDKANEYWQQSQTVPQARQASDIEELRIRELVNMWSAGNWRVARELGTYMDAISWSTDEVWEVSVQTRYETRSMETVAEPYTGQPMWKPQPILPVWDYELPPVSGLKAPATKLRLEGMDEILACAPCNGTGHLLCAICTGRGWIVCPDCQGRTKIRCTTCRGRGYIPDWKTSEKKSFFKKQAEGLASSVNERFSDMFEGIRQQGVPIPNPLDPDPATKGPTIPCPDCVNGEIECTCGTGKRVCPSCQGAKTVLCTNCSGAGKIVRHREIVRQFDLRTQTQIAGNSAIPEQYLLNASGELVYNTEVSEPLYAEAVPENVPMDVWRVAVEMAKAAITGPDVVRSSSSQASPRPTLQVLELVRIPYTKVAYRYSDQDYTLYIYDSEGKEKFYADRFPARWDRIERLVRTITADLMTPAQASPQGQTNNASDQSRGYRVPIETPPYSITEEEGE